MRPILDSSARFASSPAAWWITLVGVCLVLVAPLTLVDVPPLLDYPNHLARAYALAFGADDPAISTMVEPHWAIIPNLAIDAILPAMLKLWPVHVAGRLLLGGILVLPVLGCAALGRAVTRRRGYWPLASGLVACNELFLLGFMNFELSVGLALLAAAIWVAWRDRRPAAATLFGVVAATVLFACHLMGLLFYFVLLAAFESQPIWAALRARRVPRAELAVAVGRLLPLLPIPLLLYAMTSLNHEAPSIGWWTVEYKLVHFATALVNYEPWLDAATALLLAGFLAGCAATGRLGMKSAGVLAFAVLLILYVVSPFNFKGTSFLDVRFAVMFGFVLFALAAPRLPRRLAAPIAVVMVGVFAARMLVLADVWRGHARELAELREVIAPVQPGSRVLLATVAETDAPGYWRHAHGQMLSDGTRIDVHVAGLLLIERHAFWPFLFAEQAQQPIRLRPAFQALSDATRNIPNIRQLRGQAATSQDAIAFPLGAHWTCCYDHVLLLHASAMPLFTDARLAPIRASDFASLFRVRPDGATIAGLSPPRLAPEAEPNYVPVLE